MSTALTLLPSPGTQLHLTPGHQQQALTILDAMGTKRIDEAKAVGCYPVVLAAVGNFLLDMGHSKTLQNLDDNARNSKKITELLLERYGYLGLGEIEVVFRKAALGDFSRDEDILYLSVSNAAKWFKAYRAGQRAEVLRSIGKFQPHALLAMADGPCCNFPDDHPLWLFNTAARLVAWFDELMKPGVVYDRKQFDRYLYEFCKKVGLFSTAFTPEYYIEVLNEEAKIIYDQGKPIKGGFAATADETGSWIAFEKGYKDEELPADNRHTHRVMQACRERLLREYLTEAAVADEKYAVTVRAAVGRYLRLNPFVRPIGVELPI